MVWRKGDQEDFRLGISETGQWMMAPGLMTWELADEKFNGQGQGQVPPSHTQATS